MFLGRNDQYFGFTVESLSEISRVLLTFLNLHIATHILLKLIIDGTKANPDPLFTMPKAVQVTFHQVNINHEETFGIQCTTNA